MGLPLLAGAVGADIAEAALRGWYHALTLPPGVPDGRLFGWVWAALYVMIGLSAWLVWRRGRAGVVARVRAARGLRLWGWQLLLNAAWMPAFFGLRSPLLGLLVMVPLLLLTAATMWQFAKVRRPASWLMLPYMLWTCYAAYLNGGILWLNPLA
jgi:tryptophan-rich sensory protein